MNEPNCPNREQLGAYVAGRLAVDPHESIEQHVDRCDTCQVTVADLDDQVGTLPLGLKKPLNRAQPAPDPDLQVLVQRAKAIRPAGGEQSASPATDSAGLPVGTSLGNYDLQQRIGVGGMGQVYKAVHRRMKREVALKILSPEIVGSPVARQRFQREVEAIAKLSHPNVVVAHDADEADGHDFLVMEYVPGRNLDEIVKQDGPLPVRSALEYTQQAALGLQYAHAAGVIHRDVKPANLLLDNSGHVKILDLGLAGSTFAPAVTESAGLTSSGMMMGTAGYLAPEQALNPKTADQRADIYSLGCTLYFLLTGHPMFRGDTAMETVIAHREQPVPSLSSVRAECPRWVDQLFQSMVAKRPEDRLGSMAEIVEQISQGLQDNPLGAATMVGTGERTSRLNRPRLIAAVAAAALIALVAAYSAGVFDRANDIDAPLDGVVAHDPATSGQPSNGQRSTAGSPELTAGPNIAMVAVPAGEFWMGSESGDKTARADERPRHRVRLTRAFQLGKFEVTRGEWLEVMQTAAPPVRGRGGGSQPGLSDERSEEEAKIPVAGVSWLDAVQFCNRLSQRHGLRPYYVIDGKTVTAQGGSGFRLPTEAEWEYACRGGSTTRWPFGDDPAHLSCFSWHAGNSKGAMQTVGSLEANPFGLHDMLGNAPEWCWDRYDATYYANSEPVDPPGSTQGAARVFRGGGVRDDSSQVRSATRRPLAMHYGFFNAVGLRVARDIE